MALVTGPLGCFVVWRRLSFFGDTLAHSALLGITIAYTMEINIALICFYNLINCCFNFTKIRENN